MYLPLDREKSKKLALILIVLGVILAPDFMSIPIPIDLFVNMPMAMVIADAWQMELFHALVMTWLMAYAFIIAGLLIYPYNTKRLLLGRMKACLIFMRSHPLLLAAGIVMIYLIFTVGNVFYEQHYEALKQYAMGLIGGA